MLPQSPNDRGGHHAYRLLEYTNANPPMMSDYYPPQPGGATNFQPSLAVVLGVLAVMFSLTFALLLYAKCCQRETATAATHNNRQRFPIFSSPATIVSSGLTKKAIDSLPFFRFGTLKGSKDGLECAVCLSKFEDADILRLLPKCRHAFHIDCVDRWIAGNSTCPLCRCNVAADDASLLITSSRFSIPEDPNFSPDRNSDNPNSSANEGLELFVEREEQAGDQDGVVRRSSSFFSIGSSFRRLFARGDKALHKHNHKIVVSDVLFKNRWSNVSSSDLMFLKSEMTLSSDRFSGSGRSNRDRPAAAGRSHGDGEIIQSIEEDMERRSIEFVRRDINDLLSSPIRALLHLSSGGSGCGGDSPAVEGRRTMSEITGIARFRELGWRNHKGRENPVIGVGGEEMKRKIWLPIARRTVEWFAKREESQQTQCSRNRQDLNFV